MKPMFFLGCFGISPQPKNPPGHSLNSEAPMRMPVNRCSPTLAAKVPGDRRVLRNCCRCRVQYLGTAQGRRAAACAPHFGRVTGRLTLWLCHVMLLHSYWKLNMTIYNWWIFPLYKHWWFSTCYVKLSEGRSLRKMASNYREPCCCRTKPGRLWTRRLTGGSEVPPKWAFLGSVYRSIREHCTSSVQHF